MELLQYDFMQRALVAALLVGITAPVVGIYLVQRRLALIGDGMGHVALTGVAVGVLTGTAPVLTALVFAVAGAVTIELVRARGRTSADVVLAVMFYGGIAGGVVLMGLSPEGTANLNSYLFGAIATTTPTDLVVFTVLSVVVVLVSVLLGRQLFAVSNDEEFARASGMSVLGLNVTLAVLTAATIVISMRVVGLLLVSALMIVPNALAQLVASSFRGALTVAVLVGGTVSVAGTVGSYYAATASGGTIVLLAILAFLLAAAGSAVRQAVHSRRRRPTENHRHEHGPGCGHETISHGDHVDYLHDGHRHAAHGAHYDHH